MPKVVLKKLLELQKVLFDLKKWVSAERKAQDLSHYEIERQVQICVDLSIGIARRIISLENELVPETSAECFITLRKMKWISPAIEKKMVAAVGLRNIIIHEYDDLNYDLFFDGLPAGFKTFVAFEKAIRVKLKV